MGFFQLRSPLKEQFRINLKLQWISLTTWHYGCMLIWFEVYNRVNIKLIRFMCQIEICFCALFWVKIKSDYLDSFWKWNKAYTLKQKLKVRNFFKPTKQLRICRDQLNKSSFETFISSKNKWDEILKICSHDGEVKSF